MDMYQCLLDIISIPETVGMAVWQIVSCRDYLLVKALVLHESLRLFQFLCSPKGKAYSRPPICPPVRPVPCPANNF